MFSRSKYTTKYKLVSEWSSRQTCHKTGWWWGGHIVCRYVSYYANVQKSFRACEVGYRGYQCNIPRCNPKCNNRGVCVAVNKCDCPNTFSGRYCQTKKCSWDTDCYPGICNKALMQCSCSSEFGGPNCQNMKEGPIFQSCAASLINKRNGQNEVFQASCGSYYNEHKTYTSMRDFSHVELQWSLTYVTCVPPILMFHCAHGHQNHTLTFIMRGKTGGFKDIRNQDTAGTYENREMFGQESLRKAYVIFDLEAPFHCTEGITGYLCEHENTKPVEFDLDITSNPDISVAFPGWFDADSGIRGFTYDVYLLEVNSNGRLQNVSTPVLSKICISNFTLPNPGMYAVVAGVHDLANNTKYTRGLILYSNPNDKIEKTDIPLAVYPGPGNNTVDGAFWISDLSSPVTLQWGKHFTNKFIANNNYGSPVAPLPHQFLESNDMDTSHSFRRKPNTISFNIRDTGNNYTIHMKVEDLAGNVFTDHIYIRVDNTPPNVKNISANFTKSVKKEERGFYSSVDISASDFDGGLHFIGFTLYDILNPRDPKQIITGTQPIKKTNQFDKVMGISGVGEYPAPFGLRLKNAYGYVVILTWYLPASCYKISLINLELTGASKKSAILSANEKTAEIKEMVPYADYTARLSITYQGNRNSEAVEFKFNTAIPPTD
ncbi:hypothetical protein LSH36_138g09008 [Paralvinella palmiformis]|uniref:EGF-like domain-containing protein n=1 Tax=Paralvinella palmiformis TaxID=53620 RepID=A0AAD9N7P6_9ANNE|nr:hypothetical protein LSH36_138g09008 [Paralvinella palmiformis]